MPRRQRDDIEPEILLSDTHEQQQLATNAIDHERYRAMVYDRNQPIGRDRRTYFFDALDYRLRQCRDVGVTMNEGLLSFMMRQCDLANVRIVRDANGEPIVRDGLTVHRLVRVGCRMTMTQQQIANRHELSRQTVNHQIGIFREWYFIVNQGSGWYEFDARLCWRGNLSICAAYREAQRVRDGIVFTDGTSSLTTEDMDDSGGAE